MIINIYNDESILRLSDYPPSSAHENEVHLEFSGKKNMEEALDAFEKRTRSSILLIWSENNFDKLLKAYVKRFTLVEAAGGVVFNEHGEVLFIHRNGKWDLPKGKINGKDRKKAGGEPAAADETNFFSSAGENSHARIAALREVSEETGLVSLSIKGDLPDTYHIYTQGSQRFLKRTFWFRMDGSSRDSLVPQISEGIVIARWVPVNALGCIFAHTYDSLKPLIKSVISSTESV
jgi:8-oxo-dGTP pyrophosphatase MutT (NUDIX family)